MKPANPRPLLVFYILVSYVLIQFVWWSYLLIEQNNELYTLKKSFNLLTYNDPQLIIEEGNALEKRLHYRWMMIVGEGMVFFTLLIIAFIRVRGTFKREAALIKRQKNFIHSITHELKSPIASVKLAMETMLRHNLERDKQKEIISNAIADTDRLNTLVENILLAARIDNTLFELLTENVNFSEYIDEAIKQTISAFTPKQHIATDIQPNIFFNIDKTIFPSIFLNLFENAVKYSPQNSNIKICLKEQGNAIVLSFADEGIGILKDEEQNIFKQFYRVGNEETRKTKGTGLGLYIVKYLVEKHKGIISVRKNSPKGSIFEAIFTKSN